MKINRILLTGASGGMATLIRPLLADIANEVVLSAPCDIADVSAHEINRPANLLDPNAIAQAMQGCDAIIHLGGYSIEGTFEQVLNANIIGLYNLYETARNTGKPRIVFASTNHTVGYHLQSHTIDNTAPTRPDSLYGVSKCFGESLAQMYHDKFSQHTAIVRIGSCTDTPKDIRMLSTWLSARDFVSLCNTAFTIDHLGCPIIYGASNNDRSFWDNSNIVHLGWHPQDNAEIYAEHIEKTNPHKDTTASIRKYQGGVFTDIGILKE